VVGLSIRGKWLEIQPKEGEFRWEYFDESLKLAKENQKKVIFRVLAGASTPDWVYAKGGATLPVQRHE